MKQLSKGQMGTLPTLSHLLPALLTASLGTSSVCSAAALYLSGQQDFSHPSIPSPRFYLVSFLNLMAEVIESQDCG